VFRRGDPDRCLLEEVVLTAVIEVKVGVHRGGDVAIIEPGGVDGVDDRDDLRGVERVDEALSGSWSVSTTISPSG